MVVEDGEKKVVKEGLTPVQDADLAYEIQVALMMDRATHGFSVDKLNADIPELENGVFGADGWQRFTDTYAEWLYAGAEMIDPEQVGRINQLFDGIRDKGTRKAVKHGFVEKFGCPPAALYAAQAPDAVAWTEAEVASTTVTTAGPEPALDLAEPAAEPDLDLDLDPVDAAVAAVTPGPDEPHPF